MSFENPWLLVGTLLVALPLMLHLRQRRRAPEVPFSAIFYLLLSDKRIAQRHRLRQILVLLLRMLLLAALAVALAKPYRVAPSDLPLPAQTPTSVVLVVDNSASMQWRPLTDDGRRPRLSSLERALKRADTLIAGLPRTHNVALVTTAAPARTSLGPLTFDRRRARAALAGIEPTERGTDLAGALGLADQLLAGPMLPRRQIIVFTDLTASGWSEFSPALRTARSAEMHVIDVTRDGEASPAEEPTEGEQLSLTPTAFLPNTGIVALEFAHHHPDSTLGGALHVTVRNQRATEWSDVVTVKIGSRRVKEQLTIPPFEERTKIFHLDTARLDLPLGEVILPDDELQLDNQRHFILGARRRTRVLALNGAPSSIPYMDETFFLERALIPERDDESDLALVTMRPEELTSAQLDHSDVLVLANVAQLEPDQVAEIERFVRAGGGLFITSGDNMTPDTTRDLRPLLPAPVREIRAAGPAVASDDFTHLALPDTTHELFSDFLRDERGSLYNARVERYLLLEATPTKGTQILMRYRDGAPALIEKRLGEGRVLWLTTTVDRDWTDLPIRTAYLPLMRRVMSYLAAGSRATGPREARVGERVALALPPRTSLVEVSSPDGTTRNFVRDHDAPPSPLVLSDLEHSGIYTFDIHVGEQRERVERRYMAVSPDARDLDLVQMDLSTLQTILHAAAHEREHDNFTATLADETAASEAGGTRRRFWPPVLLSIFGLLLLETWLIVRA